MQLLQWFCHDFFSSFFSRLSSSNEKVKPEIPRAYPFNNFDMLTDMELMQEVVIYFMTGLCKQKRIPCRGLSKASLNIAEVILLG